MRWYECCIIHLVLYGIIQYYTAHSAKIPIIQTHNQHLPATCHQTHPLQLEKNILPSHPTSLNNSATFFRTTSSQLEGKVPPSAEKLIALCSLSSGTHKNYYQSLSAAYLTFCHVRSKYEEKY